jgi:hypothetical protein
MAVASMSDLIPVAVFLKHGGTLRVWGWRVLTPRWLQVRLWAGFLCIAQFAWR